MTVDAAIFRQARFIDAAIDNVVEAIRDGAIWVFVVLFLFLWNLRISLITLTAIPLSILVTALVFDYFGVTINTMTLGGIAVADRRAGRRRHRGRREHLPPAEGEPAEGATRSRRCEVIFRASARCATASSTPR